MDNPWLLTLSFIPLLTFWIILKITRFQLYLYRRKKYPDDYKRFGYHTMDAFYLKDIFVNQHKGDKGYTRLVRLNRRIFSIFIAVFILTMYLVYLYLR
jgi:uncharacterized membrane protein